MSRKKKDDETLNPKENTPPEDKVEEQPKPPEEETKPDDGAVIDPIAFEIKLKSIHPQATYGRCGYRFNKETSVEIARADLTDEQIITLANDPYLEFVPVVEGDA
ncbi:hypothetical protein [Mannheimia haemolytica]|uniref:hypothetical protein n=1 Tax=Mannheimia haemolytica TaxID=75985 RepID=UPI0001BCF81C|nr:hypothetical protein [Mannheimia haemolytica]EEY10275.1 hypothetical protein COI_1121 [Mannheimia haemolytica serotype A2 str. OVINE]EEY12039.1 hypothetical protein COK_1862 [Mannheimia haemolytica serotype A2 str. BOVINE]MDW0723716.1 hypothetical protein [Mannheimia haemolytica]MDW0736781.1 hypothetical protein [Mannheimia haemolytica]